MLGEIFQRFVEKSPISVMVRGTLERVLGAEALDAWYEQTAQKQYTRTLLFSTVYELMNQVVFSIKPSVHAAYQGHEGEVGASMVSVYSKLQGIETTTSAALVGYSATMLAPVIEQLGAGRASWLKGYRVKIIDGNCLAATEHRLEPLRGLRAGALPGKSLVVYEPALGLVTDVFPCEDGHAQERALLGEVLPTIRAGELWMHDRNFCTREFLCGHEARGAFFLSRQHQQLPFTELSPWRSAGRVETGRVAEQQVQVCDLEGTAYRVRRIRLELEEPTRDGEWVLYLLTNLPGRAASAKAIARLYRKRWTIAVSSEGHILQSVEVRPRLKDSGLVAWEAPWRESKTAEPSDNVLEIEYRQSTRLQRAVNAGVASLHAIPVAETVDNVRRQQGLGEMSPTRQPSPAGYQRRHGTKEDGSTGEARGARRGKLVEEMSSITVSGKWRRRRPGGGSGRSTVDRRATKRARREGPGPVSIPLVKVRQG